MAESTATLRQEMIALSGVDIMLDKNTFKSTYQIMDELSAKWQNLTDIQRATITELLAGKHQGNIMSSLMSNFDTARKALDTSLTSSGSAMAEHAKWSESLEARLLKLKAAWQSLSQTFMNSDFLKILIDVGVTIIDIIDKIIDKTGVIIPLLVGFAGKNIVSKIFNTSKMMQFGGGLKSVGDIVSILINAFPTLSRAVNLFSSALANGATKMGAFGAAFGALSLGSWIGIAAAAIGIGISLYNKWHESADELADRVEEITTKYKEQHSELLKLKGDYDTTNEDSMISRYGELSKGVNELGENIALTTDEYEEYQNIVEQIASTNPTLIAGYNSQGNAILECAGDIDKLSESYKNLIKEQNQEILSGKDSKNKFDNAKAILRDFDNDLSSSSMQYAVSVVNDDGTSGIFEHFDTEHLDELQNLMNIDDDKLESVINSLSDEQAVRISDLLEEYGVERDKLGSGEAGWENWHEHIIRAVKDDRKQIKDVLDQATSDLNAYAEDLGTVAGAYFNQAFLGGDSEHGIGDYSNVSDRIQNVINQAISGLSTEFYADIITIEDEDARLQELTKRYNSILDAFSGLNSADTAKLEMAFDLKTQFNGGEIPYGDYVKGVQDAGKLIDSLGLHDEVESQIKLSFGLSEKDGIWSVEKYDQMINRLTSEEFGIKLDAEKAESFINDLTASEYSVAVGLIMNDEVDLSNFNAESLRKYIEEQAKLNDALSFKIDISAETEGIEVLNTAITESVSACGLSQEALGSLQSRYKKLDSYDPAKLFERTAQGIHINRDEFNKLEKELANSNLEKIDDSLEEVMGAYEDVTEQIRICSDEAERNELLAKQSAYEDKIRELSELKAQYEGLTSAYNNWVNAQSAGEEGDIYDDVLEKLESAKELRGKGLVGTNEFAAAVGFMSGKDTSTMTVDQIVSAYEEALPKMDRYFKESSDGAKNLLGDLNKANKEWAFINESGAWEINVPIEEAAKELGISVDALESVLGKGTDYGLTINYDSVYEAVESLETLYTKAESANNKLIELGHTDLTFSFESTDVEDLVSQIENAQNIVDELNKADLADDNKINLSVDGAEDARLVLETLMRQKQEVAKPEIMKISLAMIEDEKLGNVVRSLQELQQYQNSYEIQIATGADTSQTEEKIQEIVGGLKTLKEQNPEIFTKLGLNTDEFNSSLDSILNTNLEKDVNATLDPAAIENIQAALSGIDTTVLVDGKANVTPEPNTTDLGDGFTGSAVIAVTPDTIDLGDGFTGSGTIKMTPYLTNSTVTVTVKENKVSEANGTANVNGTTGKAFKQGNWGIKDSGTALVGELGMETLVRDGKFYTIGDSGAEFIKYRKGDIIFNHLQTKELFEHGKVTSGSGRGKMFANGTAFARGSNLTFVANKDADASGFGKIYSYTQEYVEKLNKELKEPENNASGNGVLYDSSSATSSDSSSSSSYSEEEFEETFDWIEIAISRLERAIDNLDKTANNVYRSWSDRNSALADEIGKVGEDIKLQEDAAQRYLKEANSVGLNANYAEQVRNGTINIQDFEGESDEALVEKIKDYQTWYEKYLACIDAAEELRETESELYAQRFENVSAQYDGIISVIEHSKNMLEEHISQAEAQGHLVSENYYNALASNEKDNIAKLKKEKEAMLAELQTAMESGTIEKGSEAWYDLCNQVDEVTLAISESETALKEYQQTLQQLSWETFDILQDRISAVTEEANFLIELMSSDKLYDDNGKLTNEGMATMGLHGQNYNTYMHQADAYADEIARLDKEIANDPYDQDLINRRQEMLELQQESILAAQQEKEAIRDMVSEGIQLELDALQELIDKKNEALESERDLYEYQKRVKEQTEEIASLEKQLAAYSGDDSEEAQQKIQQIKVDLETARQDLQETEYDKFISDSSALLDELYLEYEEILNMRLDNLDALVTDVVAEVNANASTISATISEKADSVGYELSSSMQTIWDASVTDTTNVITTYGEKFSTAQTTTNNALNTINTNLQNMIVQLNKLANINVKSVSTSSATNTNEANTNEKKSTTTTQKDTKNEPEKTITVGGKIKASDAQIYDYAGDTSGERQLYRDDPIYTVLKMDGNWVQVRHHKLSSGVTGWFKKSDVKAYATGKRQLLDDEIAWTQDGGREFIVRPSDGAILTPVAKGDSVLNAVASNNIWNMANSPAEFIKDNLSLGGASVPTNSNVNSSVVQHFENITFSMPNVHGYNELLTEMQRDPKFEKLVLSMTVDRIAGKSSLAKGKSIR